MGRELQVRNYEGYIHISLKWIGPYILRREIIVFSILYFTVTLNIDFCTHCAIDQTSIKLLVQFMCAWTVEGERIWSRGGGRMHVEDKAGLVGIPAHIYVAYKMGDTGGCLSPTFSCYWHESLCLRGYHKKRHCYRKKKDRVHEPDRIVVVFCNDNVSISELNNN